ncbi:MFS transporter [Paraburkholderia sp. EG285A]|uniref:MFS transporter n=1 Tax=Paraburkholderia sp. EG285A TaxID=3237009 RepID=UPI0034D1EB1E
MHFGISKSLTNAERGARLAFLLAGIGATAWAPLVSIAKERVHIGNGSMGAVLLFLGIGSVAAMLVSGRLYERFGCRAVLSASLLVIAVTLPFLASADSLIALAIGLLVFGLGVGVTDCAINIWAVAVEKEVGRAIMSGLHGHFSLGGVLSPIIISLLLFARSPTVVATGVVSLLVLLGLFSARPSMPPQQATVSRRLLAIPRGPVAMLGILCFVVYLAEGAVFDWSAVFLVSERGADAAHAGLGYAAFSLAMTLCRLYGDSMVKGLGIGRVVAVGGMCSAIGLGLVVLIPRFDVSLAGFAVLGIGCSNLVPIFFTAAGKQRQMPATTAIPAIATVGYAGVLAGPSAIGAIAALFSLSGSLLVVALLLVGVSCSARFVQRIR